MAGHAHKITLNRILSRPSPHSPNLVNPCDLSTQKIAQKPVEFPQLPHASRSLSPLEGWARIDRLGVGRFGG